MQVASFFGGSDWLSELPILLAIVQESDVSSLPCLADRLTTMAYRRTRATGPWRFLEDDRNPMVLHLDAVCRNSRVRTRQQISK